MGPSSFATANCRLKRARVEVKTEFCSEQWSRVFSCFSKQSGPSGTNVGEECGITFFEEPKLASQDQTLYRTVEQVMTLLFCNALVVKLSQHARSVERMVEQSVDDHFPSESGRDRCSHAFVPCTFPSSRVRTNFLRRSVRQM